MKSSETKTDYKEFFFYVNQGLNCKVPNKYPIRQDLEILVLEPKLPKTNLQTST